MVCNFRVPLYFSTTRSIHQKSGVETKIANLSCSPNGLVSSCSIIWLNDFQVSLETFPGRKALSWGCNLHQQQLPSQHKKVSLKRHLRSRHSWHSIVVTNSPVILVCLGRTFSHRHPSILITFTTLPLPCFRQIGQNIHSATVKPGSKEKHILPSKIRQKCAFRKRPIWCKGVKGTREPRQRDMIYRSQSDTYKISLTNVRSPTALASHHCIVIIGQANLLRCNSKALQDWSIGHSQVNKRLTTCPLLPLPIVHAADDQFVLLQEFKRLSSFRSH